MNEPTEQSKKPAGFEKELGEYEVLVRDKTCNEPIIRGWKITQQLGEERFKELQETATSGLICLEKGSWAVVHDALSRARAALLYGPISGETFGPRGGWKSTTFGTGDRARTFTSRYMKP